MRSTASGGVPNSRGPPVLLDLQLHLLQPTDDTVAVFFLLCLIDNFFLIDAKTEMFGKELIFNHVGHAL